MSNGLFAMETGAFAQARDYMEIAKAWTTVPAPRAFGFEMDGEDGEEPTYLPYQTCGGLACITVDGPMMWSMDLFALCCGAYPMQAVIDAFNMAADDDKCQAILLRVDSPGGSVAGFAQLTAAVAKAAAKKPVHCLVNEMAASMAYAMACQATEIVSTASALTGSIGTICMRYDDSKAFEQAGVKAIAIASSDIKPAGNPGVPVSEGAIEMDRRIVGEAFDRFVELVSTSRKMSPENVRGMNAKIFCASDAVANGLCDKIVDADEYVASLMEKYNGQPSASGAVVVSSSSAANRITAMTPTEIREKFPAAVAEIEKAAADKAKAEAETAATEAPADATALAGAFPLDAAFCFECLKGGLTLSQAQAKYITNLEARCKTLAEEASKRPNPKGAVEPIANGPSVPTTYNQAVAFVSSRDRVTLAVASAKAAREFPALHKSWRDAGCPAND